MGTQYHIPCQHTEENKDEVLSDYHPLTTGEVIDLLETARAIKDHANIYPYASAEISSIQCRLAQAIPGSECPTPIEGPVADKMAALDEAYITWIKDPMTLFLKESPEGQLTESSPIVVTLTNLMK